MSTKTQLINGGFQDLEGNPLANGFLLMELNQDEQVVGTGQIVSKIVLKILLDSNGNVLGTPSPFTLTQVSVAAGVATYTGTITGGGGNAYSGVSFVIAGFGNGSNNGTFVATGSTTTTITFAATTQANETHAGTATGGTVSVWGTDVLTPVNAYYFVRGYTSKGQLVWGPNAQQVTSGVTFNLNTWVPNQIINWTPQVQVPTLQTNGVNNGSQAILNLKNGTSITITDDGAGGITIASTAPTNVISPIHRNMMIWYNASGNPQFNGFDVLTGTTFGSLINAATQGTSSTPPGFRRGVTALGTSNSYIISWGNSAYAMGKSLHGISYGKPFDSGSVNSTNFRIVPMAMFDQTGVNGSSYFATSGNDATVLGNQIGFFGLTNGGTANWKAYCTAAGVQTLVDTGILIDTNPHIFEFQETPGVNVVFKIDSVIVATITTHLPASGTLLFPYSGGIQNIGSPSVDVSAFYSWTNFDAIFV